MSKKIDDVDRIISWFETAELAHAALIAKVLNRIVHDRIAATEPKDDADKQKRHRRTKAEIEAAKQQTAA
jgi:hypothetical protein